MSLIESELGNAFHSPVKKKSNRTKNLRADARKVTKPRGGSSSEVMVKITGFGKGGAHVKAHLDYITRNGKLEMENESGQVFTGREEVRDLFKDWEKDFGKAGRFVNAGQSKNQRDTMHLILSMPETTDPNAVKNAVREFSKAAFGKNHEYVFALHTDVSHPHCHVTVKCLGLDGKRLNPRKADLQEWREVFAEKLVAQGVDAIATPRRTRGVVKKAERSVIRHIEQGDKTHKPRVPKVKAAKISEIAQELAAEAKGLPVAAKPWEEAIKARQDKVRRAWLSAASALEHEDTHITFNQKEPKNVRPDYDHISAERARPNQRLAALYQSDLENAGRKTSPGTVASLRNVPGCAVVQRERSSEVFLLKNAPDRMGRERRPDTEVRRPRAGDSRALSGEGGLTGYPGLAGANKALAERIRGFVGAMPALETERQNIKRDLAKMFTKEADKSSSALLKPAEPQQSTERKKGAVETAPKGGKEVER